MRKILVFVGGLLAMAPVWGQEILNTTLVGQWDGPGTFSDVWGDGDYAYIGQFGNAYINIVDISDPANPVNARRYDLPPPNTGRSAQDVKVGNGLLFIGMEGGSGGTDVHIVDVRDPENPVGLVDVDLPVFNKTHNVFYHQGYLYICDSSNPRVAIVDLTGFDPDNPPAGNITQAKWVLENVGVGFVHDITVANGRLYACAWNNGLWVYDISGIATQAPVFLGSAPGISTHSAWPTDDGKFVVTGEERPGGGIKVWRIESDGVGGLAFSQTDALALPTSEASSVHNQLVVGYRVYNSWYGAGMRAYDINPVDGTLSEAALYNTSATNGTWGVYPFLGEDKVLVSDFGAGLLILEVGTPEPPNPDVNNDGTINILDMAGLINLLGPCSCPTDLNGDGKVDLADLELLLPLWEQ